MVQPRVKLLSLDYKIQSLANTALASDFSVVDWVLFNLKGGSFLDDLWIISSKSPEVLVKNRFLVDPILYLLPPNKGSLRTYHLIEF